jgi:hypothetical protein
LWHNPDGVEKGKMKVAMMQPTFLPWQGFFELIVKSDLFIFLDDFQFSVQSYHQRNRLFVNRGEVAWQTVPVQKAASFKAPLNQTWVNESTPWRLKMWKCIQHNYSKALHYKEIAPYVEEWIMASQRSLAGLNMAFIRMCCQLMAFTPEFRLSSQRPSGSQRSERVLELLRYAQADHYYCARGAFAYMRDDGVFPVSDIEVLFQDFKPEPYEQVGSPGIFVPSLSILDALMNLGPAGTAELITNGTHKWLSWAEMERDNLLQEQAVRI